VVSWDHLVVIGSLHEYSWLVPANDLDLLVIRWTVESAELVELAPPLDLVEIEHAVEPSDAPFVVPVLRAVAARLGVDAAIRTDPIDVRAVRRLTGSRIP
jgi:hypothetical protein